MAEYVDIERATTMPGLRVVLPPGIPGPWGEAVKGLLHVKRIPYVKVRHDRADYGPLLRWTAQSSVPVMIYDNERPRSVWNDQIHLAERLGPEPRLVPAEIDDQVAVFGYCNLLAGENGLGWLRRLMMVDQVATNPDAGEAARQGILAFGARYGYSPQAAADAPRRAADIVAVFAARLDAQRTRGSRFLVGERLSALDIYWAAFAALIQPLPEQLCPMPLQMRTMYECRNPMINGATTPQLLAHRDFIYHEYLELPVDL